MSKVNDHISNAIKNINEDREITRELLDDAIRWLAKDESRHRDIGITLAKYVETLQRSNEQLVKIVGIMNKNQGSQGLTAADKDEIFDMLNQQDSEDE